MQFRQEWHRPTQVKGKCKYVSLRQSRFGLRDDQSCCKSTVDIGIATGSIWLPAFPVAGMHDLICSDAPYHDSDLKMVRPRGRIEILTIVDSRNCQACVSSPAEGMAFQT
jgi:hypothetical protein